MLRLPFLASTTLLVLGLSSASAHDVQESDVEIDYEVESSEFVEVGDEATINTPILLQNAFCQATSMNDVYIMGCRTGTDLSNWQLAVGRILGNFELNRALQVGDWHVLNPGERKQYTGKHAFARAYFHSDGTFKLCTYSRLIRRNKCFTYP